MNIEQALDVAVDLGDSFYARPRDKVENALVLLADEYNKLRAFTLKQAERAVDPPFMKMTFNADGTVTAITPRDVHEALRTAAKVSAWDFDPAEHDKPTTWSTTRIDLRALAKAINEHFKVK